MVHHRVIHKCLCTPQGLFRESRRCSRDTYPESYITEFILIYEHLWQGLTEEETFEMLELSLPPYFPTELPTVGSRDYLLED